MVESHKQHHQHQQVKTLLQLLSLLIPKETFHQHLLPMGMVDTKESLHIWRVFLSQK